MTEFKRLFKKRTERMLQPAHKLKKKNRTKLKAQKQSRKDNRSK